MIAAVQQRAHRSLHGAGVSDMGQRRVLPRAIPTAAAALGVGTPMGCLPLVDHRLQPLPLYRRRLQCVLLPRCCPSPLGIVAPSVLPLVLVMTSPLPGFVLLLDAIVAAPKRATILWLRCGGSLFTAGLRIEFVQPVAIAKSISYGAWWWRRCSAGVTSSRHD